MKEKTSKKTAKHPPCRTSAQGIRIFCHAFREKQPPNKLYSQPPNLPRLMGDETETAAASAFVLEADTKDHNAW